MELPINRDPQKIKKNWFSKFKLWQKISLIASFVVIIVCCYVLVMLKTGMMAGIIAAVMVAPVCYIATYNFHDLDFFEHIRAKRNKKRYYFESDIPGKKVSEQKSSEASFFVKLITGGKVM